MGNKIYEHDAGSLEESRQCIPPISSLPADILLQIFQMNADMDEDCPLNVQQTIGWDTRRAINATLHSSQVSSSWRDLIVNASILWANLIDLDFLHRAHSQWREIVMSRAQNSPLHVKGFLSLTDLGVSGNEEAWWLGFLDSIWPRIRKLDLDIESGFSGDSLTGDQAALYRKGLSFLSRSNRALQYFHVTMQNRWGPSESGSALFDNNAPQLRHFEVMNLHFDNESPWLSQLHAFHIHEHRGEQFSSVDDLYQVLARMEQLESLNLNTFSTDPYIAPHLVRLHFPRLKYLQFKTLGYNFDDDSNSEEDESQPTRPACWPLLNCITPALGCSVRVIIPDLAPSDVTDSYTLSRLAKNHIEVHQPTYLSVTSHPNWLAFTVDKNFLSEKSDSTEPFFTLLLEFDTNMAFAESDMRIYDIFKGLCSLSYPSVVELDISVSPEHLRSEDHEFRGFLSSLTALKKLVTDAHTLRRLTKTSPVAKRNTLFPVLDVLDITAFRKVSLCNVLLPLLRRRETPVSTLLYHAQAKGIVCTADNLGPLERLKGLKVVWKVTGTCAMDGEYTCGSGTPEALDIKTKWQRVRDSEEPSELSLVDLLGNRD